MDHYAKPSNSENRLTPAEVEIVLRRAAELNAHRKGSDTFAYSISPEVLVQVAAAAGIAESDVRRALDFSGHHTLLKVRSLELRVEDVGYGRSGISLIADVSNQRGEQLSLSGILGATLALPLAIAGVY